MTQAKAAYQLWFLAYPKLANPTDVNCREKYDFLQAVGWETFQQMQKARKAGKDWAKAKYWGAMS